MKRYFQILIAIIFWVAAVWVFTSKAQAVLSPCSPDAPTPCQCFGVDGILAITNWPGGSVTVSCAGNTSVPVPACRGGSTTLNIDAAASVSRAFTLQNCNCYTSNCISVTASPNPAPATACTVGTFASCGTNGQVITPSVGIDCPPLLAPPDLSAVCKVKVNSGIFGTSNVTINSTDTITWKAEPAGGPSTTYGYSWSGTDSLSSTSQSITKTYTTSGTKTASVTVTSSADSITLSPTSPDGSCPSVNVNCSCNAAENANYCASYTNSCGASCPGQKTCPPNQYCISTTTPNSCDTTCPSCSTLIDSQSGTGGTNVRAHTSCMANGATGVVRYLGDQGDTLSPLTGTVGQYFTVDGVKSGNKTLQAKEVNSLGSVVLTCSPANFTVGVAGATNPLCKCGKLGQKCCSSSDNSDPSYYGYSSLCNIGSTSCIEGSCSDENSTGKNGNGICRNSTVTLSGDAGCNQPCGAPGNNGPSCASNLGGSLSLGMACNNDPNGWGFLRCISAREAMCVRDLGYSANQDTCWEPPIEEGNQCGGDHCACGTRLFCNIPSNSPDARCKRRTPAAFNLTNFTTVCSSGLPAVTLSWEESLYASSYSVWRLNPGSTTWTEISNELAARSFTDTSGSPSINYTYTVRAANIGIDSRYTYSSNQYAILTPSCALSAVLKVRPNTPAITTDDAFVDAPQDNPLRIPANSSAQLSWTSSNATSCAASASPSDSTNWNWSGGAGNQLNSGSSYTTTQALPASQFAHVYTLTCSNSFGSYLNAAHIKTPIPLGPWIQTTGGDVHSNTSINTPGGP